MSRYFKNLFLDTWTNAEKFSIESNSTFNKRFVNVSTIVILIYIAIGLSVARYYGHTDLILVQILDANPDKFSTWFSSTFYGSEIGLFNQKIYWISTIVLIYLIIPILIVKIGFKQRLSDYGLTFKNVHKDYPLYLLMLVIMIPIVYIASSTSSFQDRYPIFQPIKESLFPIFIWWQIAYFIQFIAVEFFFRGFIWILCYFYLYDTVLYGSFWQTIWRDNFSDICRNYTWNIKFKKSFHCFRGFNPLFSCNNNGYFRAI